MTIAINHKACEHPDHEEGRDCGDRAVGCSKHCLCCMGQSSPQQLDTEALGSFTAQATLLLHESSQMLDEFSLLFHSKTRIQEILLRAMVAAHKHGQDTGGAYEYSEGYEEGYECGFVEGREATLEEHQP